MPVIQLRNGEKKKLATKSESRIWKLITVACNDMGAVILRLIKTEDINKHLSYLEPPSLPGEGRIFFLSSVFSVNRSLDKKSLERLSPWLACHYH